MAMSIKNPEVERLVAEIVAATGESKTEAIRRALHERRQRIAFAVPHEHRRVEAMSFLDREVWPQVPGDLLGRPSDRAEEDRILGYGTEGV